MFQTKVFLIFLGWYFIIRKHLQHSTVLVSVWSVLHICICTIFQGPERPILISKLSKITLTFQPETSSRSSSWRRLATPPSHCRHSLSWRDPCCNWWTPWCCWTLRYRLRTSSLLQLLVADFASKWCHRRNDIQEPHCCITRVLLHAGAHLGGHIMGYGWGWACAWVSVWGPEGQSSQKKWWRVWPE